LFGKEDHSAGAAAAVCLSACLALLSRFWGISAAQQVSDILAYIVWFIVVQQQ
jgi:hypothetical protein